MHVLCTKHKKNIKDILKPLQRFFFEQIILNVMQILRSEDCKSNSNLKSIKRKQHEQRVSKTAECGVGRTERSPVWLELHNNGRPFSFQGYWGIVEGFLAKGCEC